MHGAKYFKEKSNLQKCLESIRKIPDCLVLPFLLSLTLKRLLCDLSFTLKGVYYDDPYK
jgi:hypothetical protein